MAEKSLIDGERTATENQCAMGKILLLLMYTVPRLTRLELYIHIIAHRMSVNETDI